MKRSRALAARPDRRLRFHPSPTPDQKKALALIEPQALPFDPDRPTHENDTAEELAAHKTFFQHGITALWDRLFER